MSEKQKVSEDEVRRLVDAMVDLWASAPSAGSRGLYMTVRELGAALVSRGCAAVGDAKLRRLLEAAHRQVECSWGERPSYSKDYPTMETGRYHRVSVYAPRAETFLDKLRAAREPYATVGEELPGDGLAWFAASVRFDASGPPIVQARVRASDEDHARRLLADWLRGMAEFDAQRAQVVRT